MLQYGDLKDNLRSTAGVDLSGVNLELLNAVNSHGGESLVELEEINVVDSEAELLEELGDGDGWADTHDAGRKTGNGGAAELGEDGLAELLSGGALHEENSSSSISDLRGVTTSGAVTPLGEGRADLRERGIGGAVADTVISLDDNVLDLTGLRVLPLSGDGDNLLVEETCLLGSLSALVRDLSPLVLGLASDVEVLGDVLGSLTHGLRAVPGVLGGGSDGLGEANTLVVLREGHLLNAHANTNVNGTSGDLVGDLLDGNKAGRAEAVDGDNGGGVGEASSERSGAELVRSIGLVHVTAADILNKGRVDVGLLDEVLEGLHDEDIDRSVLETALCRIIRISLGNHFEHLCDRTLKALVNGVRTAQVRTTSSAFLEVLEED